METHSQRRERLGLWGSVRHGFRALEVCRDVYPAVRAIWTLIALCVAVFALQLIAPRTSDVLYGRPSIEHGGRLYAPGDPSYELILCHWRRVAAAEGIGACGVLAAAVLAWIGFFGSAVRKGQLAGEPWACRYPLRFSPEEWQALEKMIGDAWILGEPVGKHPWRLTRRPRIFVVPADGTDEERSLAEYLDAYEGELPPVLDRARVHSLAVSLRRSLDARPSAWLRFPAPGRQVPAGLYYLGPPHRLPSLPLVREPVNCSDPGTMGFEYSFPVLGISAGGAVASMWVRDYADQAVEEAMGCSDVVVLLDDDCQHTVCKLFMLWPVLSGWPEAKALLCASDRGYHPALTLWPEAGLLLIACGMACYAVDCATAEVVFSHHCLWPLHPLVSADGLRVYLPCEVSVDCLAPDGTLVWQYYSDEPFGVQLMPDGRLRASEACYPGRVVFLDPETGEATPSDQTEP